MKITKYFIQSQEEGTPKRVPHTPTTGACDFLDKKMAEEFMNGLIKANPHTSFRMCAAETIVKHGIWTVIK